MTDRQDFDENQPRDPDGKFAGGSGGSVASGKAAQRVARAGSAVERARARVAKIATKLQTAKDGRRTALVEARGALKEARKAAATARKDPSQENLAAARRAERAAAKAQKAAETHEAAIARHSAAAAEAKTQHALARELHREAKRVAKPSAVKQIRSIAVNPRGVGFERVIGEQESGAVELTSAPEMSFAIGETRIRGAEEQPTIAEPERPAAAAAKETLLERIVRETPRTGPVAPTPRPDPVRPARERRARERARQRRLWDIPGAAAVSLPLRPEDIQAASVVSLPPPPRLDAEWDEELHPRGPDGKFSSGSGVAPAHTAEKLAASATALEKAEKKAQNAEAKHAAALAAYNAEDAKLGAFARTLDDTPESTRAYNQAAKAVDALHPALEKAQKAFEKAKAARDKLAAEHATNIKEHEIAMAGGRETTGRAAIARGLIDEGNGKLRFNEHAQREIRAVTASAIREHTGITQRPGITTEINVDATGVAAGFAIPTDGRIGIDEKTARRLAEHASVPADQLTKLGERALEGDRAAWEMVFASHVITHEQVHLAGPHLFTLKNSETAMIEEVTTEMSARVVTAATHGIGLSDLPGAYDAYIEPVVKHLTEASGKNRTAAVAALAKASIEHKQRSAPAGELEGTTVIASVASAALNHLGVTDNNKHIAAWQEFARIAKER